VVNDTRSLADSIESQFSGTCHIGFPAEAGRSPTMAIFYYQSGEMLIVGEGRELPKYAWFSDRAIYTSATGIDWELVPKGETGGLQLFTLLDPRVVMRSSRSIHGLTAEIDFQEVSWIDRSTLEDLLALGRTSQQITFVINGSVVTDMEQMDIASPRTLTLHFLPCPILPYPTGLPRGGRLLANAPSPSPSLTNRETEIAWLIASGLTNKEIAERIVISPRRVATHIENILQKLNAANRYEAIISAIRMGIVPSTLLENDEWHTGAAKTFSLAYEALRGSTSYDRLAQELNSITHGRLRPEPRALMRLTQSYPGVNWLKDSDQARLFSLAMLIHATTNDRELSLTYVTRTAKQLILELLGRDIAIAFYTEVELKANYLEREDFSHYVRSLLEFRWVDSDNTKPERR